MGRAVKTHIDVQINGRPVRALIDTGSDVTTVDGSFARKMQWPIQPAKITSVKTASGEGMIIDGVCRTDMTVGRRRYQESCAMAKMTARCALYMSALKVFETP